MRPFGKFERGREVGEVSSRQEYQTGVVEVYLPSTDASAGEYDIETGEWSGGTDPVLIYRGQARWVPIRWTVDARNTNVYNASSTGNVRVQIPQLAITTIVPRTSRIVVKEAPTSPQNVGRTFIVVSDLQNSDNGTRSFECEWNTDHV